MKVQLRHSRSAEHTTASGLTLSEMVIAVSVFLAVAAMTMMALRPAWQDARLTSAYNNVLMVLRRARESAIVERRTYLVTFNTDIKCNQLKCSQLTVSRLLGGLTGAPDPAATTSILLPPEVQFLNVKGIPTSSSARIQLPTAGASARGRLTSIRA
jgi:Tfp pilus assembly protein FimT